MKLRAKNDILDNQVWIRTGEVFEKDTEAGSDLIDLGWAEEVVEEVKVPKRTAKKK